MELERYRYPGLEYKEFTEHVAESRWQTCDCQSCQEKRFLLEQLPGEKIKWGQGMWK